MSQSESPQAKPGSRALFPELAFEAYANHASVSPLSTPVCEAMQAVMSAQAREGMGIFRREIERRDRLRADFGALIGATGDDIGLVANTSAGVLAIAHGLPWRRGDRILVMRGEFPTNVTPWQQAARRHGLDLLWVDADDFRVDRAAALDEFEQHLSDGVRLVAVSAVQFTTGQRMPLAEMGEACARHGSELFVDAIQAVGSMPLDVRELGIHYLACGSHKWLMGPEGVGFVYVAPDRAEYLEADIAAWISHEDAFAFLSEGPESLRYDRPFQRGARMFEIGTFNSIGCAGLEASIGLIQSIGLEQIHKHIQAWHDALEPGLLERGFVSARMPDQGARSGLLSVQPPDGRTAAGWAEQLGARGISCASPAGWLRFAPHWPNGIAEADSILRAVDEILADRD